MKKIFYALLLFLITIVISCSSESTDSSEIIVLDLDETNANSRAMTKFPTLEEGNPFLAMMGGTEAEGGDGFWMSCNVMRSLPILPGFKRIDVGKFLSSGTVTFKAYGIPVVPKDIKTNRDGIFIRYDLKEDDRIIGRIDYYYSLIENKFSYREVVIPFFGEHGEDNIIFFEMTDVPFEIDSRGRISFKAGEIYNNGSTFTHYQIGLWDKVEYEEYEKRNVSKNSYSSFWFASYKEAMRYNNKSVTALFSERTQYNKDGSTGIMINDDNFIKASALKSKYPETIDATTRISNFNIDFVLDFLNGIFVPGIFEKNDFTSLEDFNKNGFRFAKEFNWIKDNSKVQKALGLPVTYDLNKGKGASKIVNNLNIITERSFSVDWLFSDNEKACFKERGISTESFDSFAKDLLTKLDLPKDVIDSRKTLLSDSYNMENNQ